MVVVVVVAVAAAVVVVVMLLVRAVVAVVVVIAVLLRLCLSSCTISWFQERKSIERSGIETLSIRLAQTNL